MSTFVEEQKLKFVEEKYIINVDFPTESIIHVNPTYQTDLRCRARLKKPEDAIVCCDKILDGDAFFIGDIELSTAFTLDNKGYALSLLGKFEDALEYHEKALVIDDKNEKTFVNKALAFAGLGKYEDSLKNSEHAISINQNYSTAWNNAGYALHKLGKSEDGLEYIEKAIELDPTDPDALNSKREILRALGRTD